ncbi:MAG: cytochrome C biogenesis protein [Sulfurovum sp.]|nr:MAG: cytochrome C biogenesis protein [Sulfurovum sp.]
MNPSDYCIISTTTDTKENAKAITQSLLQQRLIACAQSSTIDSSYRWQGKIILSKEIHLQMKTKKSLFTQIKQEIEKLHTYDVPEILMLPLLDANEFYLKWIDSETL